jgi:hypothetical protein
MTKEALVRLGKFSLALLASLISLVSTAYASNRSGDKADAYFGYSRAGANLYAPYTPAMNGWQLTAHIKPMPFVGIVGDFSHYSESGNGYSQHVTLAMFGPRVTLAARGISVFAHVLGGFAHGNGTLTTYPSVSYIATSYAFGGGTDLPVFHSLKLRVTGDYLGDSKAPSSSGMTVGSVSHSRFGAGLVYHFRTSSRL